LQQCALLYGRERMGTHMILRAFPLVFPVLVFFFSLTLTQAGASDTLGLKEIKYGNDSTHHVIVITDYRRDKSARGSYGKPLCSAVEENAAYRVQARKKDEVYFQFRCDIRNEYEKPVKVVIIYTVSEHRGNVWESIDSGSRTLLTDTRCQVSACTNTKPLKMKERNEYRVAVRYIMDDDEAYRASPIITIEQVGGK